MATLGISIGMAITAFSTSTPIRSVIPTPLRSILASPKRRFPRHYRFSLAASLHGGSLDDKERGRWLLWQPPDLALGVRLAAHRFLRPRWSKNNLRRTVTIAARA